MAMSTAHRGTELPSTNLAVSGATKTAKIIVSFPDPIAQDLKDHHSLDRILAYCRRNLSRALGVAQTHDGNILPTSTPQPSSATDNSHRAALRAQRHTVIQEQSLNSSHNTDPSATASDSNQLGLNEDLEINTLSESSNTTPGAHTSGGELLSAEALSTTSERPEHTEHGFLSSIPETVTVPGVGLGLGSLSTDPNIIPREATSPETTIDSPLQDLARLPPSPGITFESLSDPATGSESRTKWKRLPRFRFFGDNTFLATSVAPDEEYLRQWREVWQPTLLHKVDTLSVDEADIFVFDLKMVGSSPKAESLKPTILAICSSTVMQKLKHGLEEIIREITPKDIDFLVIGRDIKLASPGVLRRRHRDSKISLEVEFMHDLLDEGGETNAYKAQVYLQNRVRADYTSTVGGYILIGTSLFALTTGHSLFSGNKKPMQNTKDVKDTIVRLPFRGNVESYSWSLSGGAWVEKNRQERSFNASLIPMDWALVSISPSLDSTFVSPIDLFRTSSKAKQHIQRPATTSFKGVENLAEVDEVIIHGGCSGVQSGILSKTSCIFKIGKVSFIAYSVALDHCLVDGDSGSWVVSQSDNELCGYIFARVIGFEWAYMLPISPIIEDIRRVAPRENENSVSQATFFSVAEIERAMADRKKYLSENPEKAQPSNVSVPTKDALTAQRRAETRRNFLGSSEMIHTQRDPSRTIKTRPTQNLPLSTEIATYGYNLSRRYEDVDIPLRDLDVDHPTNAAELSSPIHSLGETGHAHSTTATTRSELVRRDSDIAASWIPQFAESTPSIVHLDKTPADEQDIEPGSLPNNGRRSAQRGQSKFQRFVTSMSAVFKRLFPYTYRHIQKHVFGYILLVLLVNHLIFLAALGTYVWLVIYCTRALSLLYLIYIGILFGFIAFVVVWLIGNRVSQYLLKYVERRRLWQEERGFLWHMFVVFRSIGQIRAWTDRVAIYMLVILRYLFRGPCIYIFRRRRKLPSAERFDLIDIRVEGAGWR